MSESKPLGRPGRQKSGAINPRPKSAQSRDAIRSLLGADYARCITGGGVARAIPDGLAQSVDPTLTSAIPESIAGCAINVAGQEIIYATIATVPLETGPITTQACSNSMTRNLGDHTRWT